MSRKWVVEEFRHEKKSVFKGEPVLVENKPALYYGNIFGDWYICDEHMGMFNLWFTRDESIPEKKLVGSLFECIEFAERWTGEQHKEEEAEVLSSQEEQAIQAVRRDCDNSLIAGLEDAFGVELPVRGQEIPNSTHRSFRLTANEEKLALGSKMREINIESDTEAEYLVCKKCEDEFQQPKGRTSKLCEQCDKRDSALDRVHKAAWSL